MGIEDSIRTKLTASLNPIELNIINDSAKHAGHAAMRGGSYTGETHFTVQAVSSAFEGKNTLKRHRLVHGALADEFAAGLHALILVTKTPAEAGIEPVEEAPAPEMPVREGGRP